MPENGIWDLDLSGMGLDADKFKGQVVLLVNTASRCGFTPQLEVLESLQQRWRFAGFTVLAIPSKDFGDQEFDDHQTVCQFYTSNFHTTFPISLLAGIKDDTNPLHAYLLAHGQPAPTWNFHKYVIGRDGRPMASFASAVSPDDVELMLAIAMALAEDPPESV